MTEQRPLTAIRPTQLYLSGEKLRDVLDWFDFDTPTVGPLPVFEHDGETYLSDGHTRAFVAYLAGEETIPVKRDEDIRETYDFDIYLQCLTWCENAGIETVADLRGRVVEPSTYEEVWIQRCQRLREP